MAKYEAQWDEILKSAPYTLRFYSATTPEEISIDDSTFLAKLTNDKDIDIIIEWSIESYYKIKSMVNEVVVDQAYHEWKKERDELKFEVGDYLDVRDLWRTRYYKWHEVIVKIHKHAKEE
eukprot:40195_1